MLFNSFEYLLFFPLVAILYYLLAHQHRWALLLGASCIFYMYFVPAYILILFVLIGVDYVAGIWIEASQKNKKTLLVLSLIANISGLALFKYYNFIAENINFFLGTEPPAIPYLSILLPIGLSFHTFQSMAYTIEVYRGKQKAEHHLGIYALYVLFFPQLVAGPIERPQNMLPQFYKLHRFKHPEMMLGINRILWGLFKKVVIADRLALIVNPIYNNPENYDSLSLLIATYLFAFQIYCDFSGYCDIAIGSAKILGFKLSENFKQPYLAQSPGEFWRRWHITLSQWFRDYLYIPLGGNRKGIPKQALFLLIVFLISGLWHGAHWHYVAWGAYHGVLVALPVLFFKAQSTTSEKRNYFKIFLCFHLVLVSWILFRANTLSDAWYIARQIIGLPVQFPAFSEVFLFSDIRSISEIGISFLLIILMMIAEAKSIPFNFNERNFKRYSYYMLMLLLILIMGQTNKLDFIYFQF